MKDMRALSGLYAITDARVSDPHRLVADVEQALRGGARLIQYRNKSRDKSRDKSDHQKHHRETCQALRALTQNFNALLIINDDIELAKQCHADGVHLGKNDAAISTARDFLGPGAIIGVSCYNRIDLARRAVNSGADYIAFGRFFTSRTKPDAVPASLDLLIQAKQMFDIPIVAIGGITAENGSALIAAGAHMLAVVDDIFGHTGKPNAIEATASRYQALFDPLRETPKHRKLCPPG